MAGVTCKPMPAAPHAVAGWGCCACAAKNGMGTWNPDAFSVCKHCGHTRCDVGTQSAPDLDAEAILAHVSLAGRRIVNAMAFAPSEHLVPALREGITRDLTERGIAWTSVTAQANEDGGVLVQVGYVATPRPRNVLITIGFERVGDPTTVH